MGVRLCFFVFRGGFEQDVENGYHQHPDTCHGEMEQTHLFLGIYMINKGRFKTTDCYQISMAAGATDCSLNKLKWSVMVFYFSYGCSLVHVAGA